MADRWLLLAQFHFHDVDFSRRHHHEYQRCPQQLAGHDSAFDVPAEAAIAPGTGPAVSRFGQFPQRGRRDGTVPVVDLSERRHAYRRGFVRIIAVFWLGIDAEIDAIFGGVGMPLSIRSPI